MNYENLDTPCFILVEQELFDSIKGFQEALGCNFQKSIVGYSVKTNSLPYALKQAIRLGCYAEVVSGDEYQLAKECGCPINHIIYNGPSKTKETFLEAITEGAIVNIEAFREIEWLKDLPLDKKFKIGIRLNIDISMISPADENHENDNSRFGFSAESGDFEKAIESIKKISNIQLVGLHTHRTSRTRSLDFYKNVIQYTQTIISKYNLQLEYWDLGGGYFGMMPNKPTYKDYSDAFFQSMNESNRNLTIIVEPGNALVASAFDYVTSVIDIKEHDNALYVTTNGTRNDIDPFFHKTSYFHETLTAADKTSDKQQIVCGSTCLEYDRLFTIECGQKALQLGDKIIYHRVGAYTMCLTPLFINYFPIVYTIDRNGKISVARNRWSAKDYTKQS